MNETGSARYIAHVSDDGTRKEDVACHLAEVAQMASSFAEPFGAESWAYAAGLLHDVGKFSKEFQRRILDAGPKVDHSTAGALVMQRDLGNPLLAYCVAGHHGGLPDGGTSVDDGVTLFGRLAKARRPGGIPDFSAYTSCVDLPQVSPPALASRPSGRRDDAFSLTFLTRMVFSCLVDADFLCTERFMAGGERQGLHSDGVETLRDELEKRISGFYPPKGSVNELRCRVLDDCLGIAGRQPGVYSLTAPTGAGKTFALMRFALQHAVKNGMRRVICAEPYTSIIEQNAQVYRDVFGDENVLEHHASFDFDASELSADARGQRLRLAAENWGAPVVVTTNVQLFESLYASSTSRCRKLHNIARSVIVLDEAQMIPTPYLLPCIKALAELVRNYGCSVVLCSATQPALLPFFEEEGLPVSEIVSDVETLFAGLHRVVYRALGPVDDEGLACRLAGHDQALCVVNNRRQACGLYELVKERTPSPSSVFCLTTLMHPHHRKRVLAQVRSLVAAGEPCVVIATSLVEAGVDLDFPVLYRAVAGIDSIVQAAGRCNREGRRPADESIVYLFESATPYGFPQELRQRASVAKTVLPGLGVAGSDVSHADALDTVDAYFGNLYYVKGKDGLDCQRVVDRLSSWSPRSPSIDFAAVANEFHLVEDGSYPVIVPCEDVAAEVARLEAGFATRADMRRLAMFSVNLYQNDIAALQSAGVVRAVGDGVYLLDDVARYGDETGLDLTVEGGQAFFW